MATAATGRIAVLQRAHATIPVSEAAPTTMVMATSVGEKWPVTMRAHPLRNSQIAIMIASQKTKHGNAAHFASRFCWRPTTIGNHKGSV